MTNELATLSPQQARILRFVVQGKSAKEIVRETGLSEGTVKIHTTEAFRRLAVHSRAQAIVKVARMAGIDLTEALDAAREVGDD